MAAAVATQPANDREGFIDLREAYRHHIEVEYSLWGLACRARATCSPFLQLALICFVSAIFCPIAAR